MIFIWREKRALIAVCVVIETAGPLWQNWRNPAAVDTASMLLLKEFTLEILWWRKVFTGQLFYGWLLTKGLTPDKIAQA